MLAGELGVMRILTVVIYSMKEKLEKILREISKNCLKGQEVPVFLEELWKDKLEGYCFAEKREYGELILVSKYSEGFFEGYDKEFIGDERIAKTYVKMFEEIAFIGTQSDNSMVGYWLFKPGISLLDAPIISLDDEGIFHLESDSLENYFVIKALLQTRENAHFVDKLQAYLLKHNLPQAKDIAEIQLALKTFPDPEKRFEEYFNTI
jgi:hypothetical protein